MFGRAIEALRRFALRWRAEDPHQIPFRKIRSYLPSNPVIVEAGAHRGQHTTLFARLWPDATIHAFEPVPELYAEVVRRTSRHPQVRCYPLALSDRTGEATIHISEGGSDASSSLLPPSGHLTECPHVFFRRQVTIPTITLDEWAEQHAITRVDFFWLDLQGHELTALKGGERLLETVRAIHTEVSLKPLYEGGALYPELRDWLGQRGFEVVAESLPNPAMGDALFVRR